VAKRRAGLPELPSVVVSRWDPVPSARSVSSAVLRCAALLFLPPYRTAAKGKGREGNSAAPARQTSSNRRLLQVQFSSKQASTCTQSIHSVSNARRCDAHGGPLGVAGDALWPAEHSAEDSQGGEAQWDSANSMIGTCDAYDHGTPRALLDALLLVVVPRFLLPAQCGAALCLAVAGPLARNMSDTDFDANNCPLRATIRLSFRACLSLSSLRSRFAPLEVHCRQSAAAAVTPPWGVPEGSKNRREWKRCTSEEMLVVRGGSLVLPSNHCEDPGCAATG
jgi:hypothetical protein